MKFYKLELINREQSYNQMFGKAPTLGSAGPFVANMSQKPVTKQQSSKTMMMQPGMQSKKIL